MGTRVPLLLAVVLLSLTACTISVSPAPQTTLSAGPQPPAGISPVVLDETVPGWSVETWLTASGFCQRTIGPQGDDPDRVHDAHCTDLGALGVDGPPLLAWKPVPQSLPPPSADKRIMLIGAVRGEVAEVTVTMSGSAATARVLRLPGPFGHAIGAYAVWLPFHEVSTDNITGVVAYAADGTALTWINT